MAGGMASGNSFVPLRHRLSTAAPGCCCVLLCCSDPPPPAAAAAAALLHLHVHVVTDDDNDNNDDDDGGFDATRDRPSQFRRSTDKRKRQGQTKAQTRSAALGALLLLPPLPPPLVRSFSRTTLLIPSEKHCTITCSCAELGDSGDDDDNTTENDDGPRNETTA